MKLFEEYIETHRLLDCDACIVGVSGGSDSMCLLDLLLRIKEHAVESRTFPHIVAVHVHHGLRGQDADDDLSLVKAYCDKKGVAFHSRYTDIAMMAKQEGLSIEHAGRNARHEFFEKSASDYESNYVKVRIALAHQREDKAETMMMNLFRGSGLDGLCAMPPLSGRVIRPLLFASKMQIMSYLEEYKVPFRHDQTNLSDDFSRNVWRNRVFPLLKTVAIKDPVDALIDVSAHLETDKEYIDMQAHLVFTETVCFVREGKWGIPCDLIANQHPAIAGRLVRLLFELTYSDLNDLSADRIQAILRGVRTGKGNVSFSLSGDKKARINANTLYFETDDEERSIAHKSVVTFGAQRYWLLPDTSLQWSPDADCLKKIKSNNFAPITIEIGGLKLFIEQIENPSKVVYNDRVWYCPTALFSGLTVRTPRSGDRVSRAGESGSKLFRRYLTDCKVPSSIRSRLLVFVRHGTVLWFPGVVHAEGFVNKASHDKYLHCAKQSDALSSECTNIIRIEIIETKNNSLKGEQDGSYSKKSDD